MRITLVLSALFLSSMNLLPSQPAGADQTATATTLLDINSRIVQAGTNYYVLPVIRRRGGGLALASRNRTCPFNVVQENFDFSNGLPLKIFPTDLSEKVIRLSTDANFMFSAATICVQWTVWRLGGVDGMNGRRYVTSGGVMGNPGIKTVSNWFKIERYMDNYKIVFCPSVCSSCKVVCGDVGVFYEGEKIWLGLSDAPLLVMFKKV